MTCAPSETAKLALRLAKLDLDGTVMRHVPPDALDGDQPAVAVEDRRVPVLGPHDPATCMDPPKDDGIPEIIRVVAHGHGNGAVVRVKYLEGQIGMGEEFLRRPAANRHGRRADVLGAESRMHSEPVDHIARVFGEQFRQHQHTVERRA